MMKASKNRAIKLVLILALACLYSVAGFAGARVAANQSQPLDNSNPSDDSISAPVPATNPQTSAPCDPTAQKSSLWGMRASEARCRSLGCVDCHQGIEDMHNGKVNLGCIDCHGGHAEVRLPAGAQKGSTEYKDAERKAHVQPRLTGLWK